MGKRYSIHDYATYFFSVDRKSLEKVIPHCLFISIISLPADAVQREVTLTSSQAASSSIKRTIATSDDKNGREDDEVEDMTNQKLQSKGINSVKRQKTKTSDGEKAPAAREKKTKERREKRERRENQRKKRRKMMRMIKKREKRERGETKRRMRTMKKRRKRKKRRISNPQPHVAK